MKDRPQCALLLISNGKVLLQLRDNSPWLDYPNHWGTFGGQIELGETPEEAIVREIKEELNYNLQDFKFLGNYSFQGYDQFVFYKIDDSLRLENLKITEGQGGRFFSREEIKKVKCAFNCREIVQAYYDKITSS